MSRRTYLLVRVTCPKVGFLSSIVLLIAILGRESWKQLLVQRVISVVEWQLLHTVCLSGKQELALSRVYKHRLANNYEAG